MYGLLQWLPELSVASFQSIMHKTERILFPKCKPDCTTLLFKTLQWFDTALRDKVLTGPIKSSLYISIQSYVSLLYCLGLAKLALFPPYHCTLPQSHIYVLCSLLPRLSVSVAYYTITLLLVNSDVLFGFSSNTTSSGKPSMNSQATPDSTLIIVIMISFIQGCLPD